MLSRNTSGIYYLSILAHARNYLDISIMAGLLIIAFMGKLISSVFARFIGGSVAVTALPLNLFSFIAPFSPISYKMFPA
jgi:hypothetical protein